MEEWEHAELDKDGEEVKDMPLGDVQARISCLRRGWEVLAVGRARRVGASD